MKTLLSKTLLSFFIIFVFTIAQSFSQDWNKLKIERVESGNKIIWEQVSPGNAGFANLLRYHPTIPGKVLLCPDMWNAYMSDNNGHRWYGITDCDGDGSFNHLRDAYFSSHNLDFGLALCSSELWQSHDMGKSWKIVKNCPWYKKDIDGSDKDGWKKKVASLGLDPNNEDIWFVGGGSNVRGQEWLSCYRDVNSTNPHGFTAFNEGKLWRTVNAGKSWRLVTEGIDPKAQIGRIIINPKNSKQVFASSNYGIYKSENGGDSWKQISNGKLDNDIIMDMDYYYNKQTGKFTLYVIDQVHYIPFDKTTKCNGGIFSSDDEGQSWQNITGNLGLDINRLSGGVPENYYGYIAKWFNISIKEARSRYPILPKNALQYFNMISTDPSRQGAVYIGFADPQVFNSIMPGRLWTTTDNGKEWINTARLYEDAWTRDSDYWIERGNPINQNMSVGHASPHMRFGSNYALRSMRGLDVGVDGSVMIISDHSTMLSTDHGKSWKQMDEDYTPSGALVGHRNSNLPGLTIAQDLRKKTTLLGSGEHRLWIPSNDSPDERIAIKYIPSAQASVNCLAFDPYDVNIVYSTSSRQEDKQYLFRSIDRGETWEKYGIATPATNKWLDDFYTNALTVDPINNNYIYFGITNIVNKDKQNLGGFYYSDNNGKSFKQSNTGLPEYAKINDIKFDPRDKSMCSLFAAAQKNDINNSGYSQNDGGLYHSNNRGKSWIKVNTPSSVKGVQFIYIDNTNRMYITTGYRGGGDGVWYTDNFGKDWHQIFKYNGAECIDVSPFDNNIIAVSVRYLSVNPGVYISFDRGKTWNKSNKSIGIPHQIEDLKFDIHNPSELWLATLGCGFYKGKIEKDSDIQVVKIDTKTIEGVKGDRVQLNASIINAKYQSKKIVWKSENNKIASVDKKGIVKMRSNGNVKIWAITHDGRFSDCAVVVVRDVNKRIIKENKAYSADWHSLSKHKIPDWLEDMKFGIYCHWGPQTVQELYENRNELNILHAFPLWTGEKFNPKAWAELFKRAGAQFAGPVSQHCSGCVNWNSQITDWNSVNHGPRVDILGSLSKEIHSRGMKLLASFHSLTYGCVWGQLSKNDRSYCNPILKIDSINRQDTRWMEGIRDRIHEACSKYNVDIAWFDTSFGFTVGAELKGYMKKAKFIYDNSPKNRIGGMKEKTQQEIISDFYNNAMKTGREVEVVYKSQDIPVNVGMRDIEDGNLDGQQFDSWMTDISLLLPAPNRWSNWFYNSKSPLKDANCIVDMLIDITSKNGRMLLNVPPKVDGTFADNIVKELYDIGDWLKINGEGIYSTTPWCVYGEGPTIIKHPGHHGQTYKRGTEIAKFTCDDVRYTSKGKYLYAFVLAKPESGKAIFRALGSEMKLYPNEIKNITLLGSDAKIKWQHLSDELIVDFPKRMNDSYAYCFKIERQ